MKTVGAYEAKTHLPQLLEEVAKGEKIIITKHGVPVASLQSVNSSRVLPIPEVIDRLKKFRQGQRLKGIKIRDLINEGRR